MQFIFIARDTIRESSIYYILSEMAFYERLSYPSSLFLTIGYLQIPISHSALNVLSINGLHQMNLWIYKSLNPYTEPVQKGDVVVDSRKVSIDRLAPYQHVEIMKSEDYETYYDYDSQWVCISQKHIKGLYTRIQIATQILIDLNNEGRIVRFWIKPYFVGSFSEIDMV